VFTGFPVVLDNAVEAFAGIEVNDGEDFVLGTTTGTKIGTAASQKLGFYGITPAVQPAHTDQAAVATTAITTASTTTTPAGYATTTQADNLATIVAANRTLVNQMRSDLVAIGILKGSN
jgi:hypothetical protein